MSGWGLGLPETDGTGRRMIRAFVGLLLAAGPAFAEGPAGGPPMTVEAFEAFSTGHTVTYGADGVVFGREEYRPGRVVVWQVPGGGCEFGHWFGDDAGNICFLYGEGRAPVCWAFSDRAGQVTARSIDNPDAPVLGAMAVDETPLACLGPDVGV